MGSPQSPPEPGLLSAAFVQSEEFAIGFVSALVVVGVAGPLLVECVQHIAAGNVPIGCTYGVMGLGVIAAGGRTIASTLYLTRERY